MSRRYEMRIEVSEYDPNRRSEIQAAAEKQWAFEDWWEGGGNPPTLHASGESWLCGGETEEEFAERLSVAIWRANGDFCSVIVDATCLEDLPHEMYVLDEEDYERLMQQERVSDSGGK